MLSICQSMPPVVISYLAKQCPQSLRIRCVQQPQPKRTG